MLNATPFQEHDPGDEDPGQTTTPERKRARAMFEALRLERERFVALRKALLADRTRVPLGGLGT